MPVAGLSLFWMPEEKGFGLDLPAMSSTVIDAMNSSIKSFDLLEHAFYRAWSEGTLPTETLAKYAREYGAFIRSLPSGWRTLGDESYAKIEEAHAALWDGFAGALGTSVGEAPEVNEVRTLVTVAKEAFASGEAATIGALYAFEVQQPATAASKLEGLKTHYATLPKAVQPYFKAHENDVEERDMLEAMIEKLPADQQAIAKASCARMSEALWNALTGIHGEHAGCGSNASN